MQEDFSYLLFPLFRLTWVCLFLTFSLEQSEWAALTINCKNIIYYIP